MIIIGYPGIGKTSIAGKEGCVDLESSNFFVSGERAYRWQVIYCNIAIDLHKQGYTVFVSSHDKVVDELQRRELLGAIDYDDVKVIHPSLDLYTGWLSRLHLRYVNDRSEKNERALWRVRDFYYGDIEKLIYGPFANYQLCSIEYDLLDVVKKIKEENV